MTLGLKKNKKGRATIVCPFHKEETPSCLLDFDDHSLYCLGCGKKGKFEIKYLLEEEANK